MIVFESYILQVDTKYEHHYFRIFLFLSSWQSYAMSIAFQISEK